MSAFKPDLHFPGGLIKRKRVVSLVIDFEDGAREILEFADDNRAYYRVYGKSETSPGPVAKVTRQYYSHELWWSEEHIPKENDGTA